LTDFAVLGRILNKILTDLHGQVDVTGAIPEQWNADELRRRFERHFLVWPCRFEQEFTVLLFFYTNILLTKPVAAEIIGWPWSTGASGW
jgi:hypothetical protein